MFDLLELWTPREGATVLLGALSAAGTFVIALLRPMPPHNPVSELWRKFFGRSGFRLRSLSHPEVPGS